MPSLLDRDQTRQREEAYPDIAGNQIKAISEPMLEAHFHAMQKYVDWIRELVSMKNVHWGVKMAVLGGEDPLAMGGSIPAIMMAKLEELGVQEATISGSMNVSESNKASQIGKTIVQSTTTGGIGTPFWRLSENLKVTHSSSDEQTRSTDYRAKVAYSIKFGPIGVPEGVSLIKEACGKAFDGVMRLNQSIIDAQLEELKDKIKNPSGEDVDKNLEENELKTGDQASDDSDDNNDDVQDPQEETGDNN